MRAVVQRVSSAEVSVVSSGTEEISGRIGPGVVVYLGVGKDDSPADAAYLADKVANLRIFMDAEEKMNLSLKDLGYSALVVSQFTLYADARKGRRPSYSDAAGNELALELYGIFCGELSACGIPVQTGKFRETMRVKYVNEGPVTILLDSKKAF
jgi:D-tyrosyl-tRNA(Tyr) deacylase